MVCNVPMDEAATMTEPGYEVLDALYAALTRYVAFPDEHSTVATALWITTTHALGAFEFAPRLAVTSPEKRCGKSRLLDIVAGTCHRPLASVDATVAAIFRSLGGDHPPTLIIDEADAIFGNKKVAEQNEDLRKLLNAGHQRGRPALRCVGPHQTPTEFPTFAMVALAGIGKLPDTITDRAINISMQRRAIGESVSQFRSRRDGPALAVLRERLAAWGREHTEELSKADPDLPVDDRAADTWEPLIAVADAAGGDWPKLARLACRSIESATANDDDDASLNVKLLIDIRAVFAERGQQYLAVGGSFLPSQELVVALRRIEESPWGDFELTPRKLAQRLKLFGIKPGFNAAKTQRGYVLEGFTDAFGRYLRPKASNRPKPGADQQEHAENEDIQSVRNPSESVRDRTDGRFTDGSDTTPEAAKYAGPGDIADTWTLPDAPPAENGHGHFCACGAKLLSRASIERGQCEECRLTANK